MPKADPEKFAKAVLSLLAGIEAQLFVHHEQFLKYARDGKLSSAPEEEMRWQKMREEIRSDRFREALRISGLDDEASNPGSDHPAPRK